jgi:GTPase involved in cell partitioning and DNA repair
MTLPGISERRHQLVEGLGNKFLSHIVKLP